MSEVLSLKNSEELLEKTRQKCAECQKCPLGQTRTKSVFSSGAINNKLMLIGEAPGYWEDQKGEPFVGKAGQLLDKIFASVGLSRQNDVYICNTLKCRPPENRDPLGVEQDACIGYLRRQVALLRPKIIVCLGRIAAMRIIKPDFKITREHGQWFEKNGFQMMAVYHPAALLRDPRRRPESFEDFKGLQQKINELCEHTHAVS